MVEWDALVAGLSQEVDDKDGFEYNELLLVVG